MPTTEPLATAVFLGIIGVLLGASVLSSRASQRFAIPVALIFLIIGMLAGSEGIGGIAFDDYRFAFRVGTVALVLILFDGGLNTPLAAVRETIRPAGLLATVGVIAMAAVVALGARALGFSWPHAMLLGAVVSSTDAALVFAVLRGSGISLRRRVATILEVESGMNDPMAVILTMSVTQLLLAPGAGVGWRLLLDVPVQIVLGTGLGIAIAYGGRVILSRLHLSAGGLYPVMTLAIAIIAFAVPTMVGGSGFVAVYVAGLVLGNGPLPYRQGLTRVHDALAWLSQVGMFLILGLLVFPSRLPSVALVGLALALFIACIARPVVVALFLLPFRFPRREVTYMGWVGLRGAVPIILATFPVIGGAPGAEHLFDIVFFIVVVNAIIPGATVPWVTRKMGLESHAPPRPPAALAIESVQPLNGELMSFHIDSILPVVGMPLSELPFPEGASAMLIVRDGQLVAPRGRTTLDPGDHIYIFAREQDRPFIQLMFGRPEGD